MSEERPATRRLSWAASAALLLSGAILCTLHFEKTEWQEWIHSPLFSLGLLAVLLAVGIIIGTLSGKVRYGSIVFCVLLVIYFFLVHTFIGWLILWKAIHWAIIPGPTPQGM